MNNIDGYKELIVCTGRDEIKIENSIEAVSDAICKYGIDGDISIYTADYRVLNTFGIYVDRCFNSEYMEKLRPALVEKQLALEAEVFSASQECLENKSQDIQM